MRNEPMTTTEGLAADAAAALTKHAALLDMPPERLADLEPLQRAAAERLAKAARLIFEAAYRLESSAPPPDLRQMFAAGLQP